MMARCRHCGVEIRELDYGTGPQWLHIETSRDSAPGQPYRICKTHTVAQPPETVKEWADKLLKPHQRKDDDHG